MEHTSEPLSRLWCHSCEADRTAFGVAIDLHGRKPNCHGLVKMAPLHVHVRMVYRRLIM